ncbi:hypothetical protein AB0F30_33355 [Streptomyces sp. NPDC029006]
MAIGRPINPGEVGDKLAKAIRATSKKAAKTRPQPGTDDPQS